jgi:hypothetical protein
MSGLHQDSLTPPPFLDRPVARRVSAITHDSSARSRSVPNVKRKPLFTPEITIEDNDAATPETVVAAAGSSMGGSLYQSDAEVIETQPSNHEEQDKQKNPHTKRQDSDPTSEETGSSPGDTRSNQRRDSNAWSESETIVPRRNLTIWDVASLIFNKMVRSDEIWVSREVWLV